MSEVLKTLADNMRRSFIDRKCVKIGGGMFWPEELKHGAIALAAFPDMLAALIRLSDAAFARDTVMGDPCALLAAQAELRDANKLAMSAIAQARGER